MPDLDFSRFISLHRVALTQPNPMPTYKLLAWFIFIDQQSSPRLMRNFRILRPPMSNNAPLVPDFLFSMKRCSTTSTYHRPHWKLESLSARLYVFQIPRSHFFVEPRSMTTKRNRILRGSGLDSGALKAWRNSEWGMEVKSPPDRFEEQALPR